MITDTMKAVYKKQSQLMGNHYQKALEAKKKGIPIVYVTAMFPVEIVRAFEPHVYIVYPENHAVLMITRGHAGLAQKGEDSGLDRMGCAYELINTGYLLNGHGKPEADYLADSRERPLPKLPEPDILLSCDNQCRVVCEWFKNISELSGNIPYSMINVGDRFDGSLESTRIEYVINQLEGVIRFLEEQTGITLDRERLLEVARLSKSANKLWQQYLDMGTQVPSPVSVFDAFSHMALIVSERGHREAIDYYELLISAINDAVEKGIFPVSEEKHRLLWDNLATWYNFRDLQEMFTANGLALVGSTYLDGWRKQLDDSSYENLLESMAKTYSSIYTTMTIPQRIEHYREMVDRFKADGILFHKNMSCHTFSLRVHQIAKSLEDYFGPDFRTVVFEGCQGMEGRFQKHAFETGITVHFMER